MTRRRFYAPPESFAPDLSGVSLSSEESRHLRDVLRLREGDEAFVFDGEGREFSCVVRGAGGRGVTTLDVLAQVEPPRPESPLALTLAVALLKGEKFDLVVQKATELGATRIVPVITKRADVRLRDDREAPRRIERWRRLALEACKQSGRASVPHVVAPAPFASVVAHDLLESEARLMFSERDGEGLNDAAGKRTKRPQSVAALVGPEGGWEDEEIERARDEGWTIITLGGRTLRAETAAVVVSVLLQHLFGDLV